MAFADVILSRLDELDLNVNQAEARAGLPQGYIRGVIRNDEKRAIPNLDKAARICEALGLEFYFGPPRDHGAVEVVPPKDDDFAKIPIHEATLAAGSGSVNGAEEIVGTLAFRSDWLRKLGVVASKARVARVHGDSMAPTLCDGDMILIDTSKTEVVSRSKASRRRPPPIYAFVEDGAARVKRIERIDEDFYAVMSDNPEFQTEFKRKSSVNSMKIIGKVLWWGHTSQE
ncbi:S24 family peptidase [Rhodobacter lacus]|uniref:Helix-turn-helix transcriptional regulator n=1 Tax=Rhodobacter lacus TaxID=1641972 RepID=A0ABW5A4N1_9RHOB